MAAAIQTKRVQELAESGNGPPPDRYIQTEPNRPIGDPSACAIPIIDLSLLFHPNGDKEVAKLRSALSKWGLFQVVGHRLETSLLDEVRRTAREFFGLPMEEKQRYSSVEMDGYGNDRIVSDDQVLDWSDRIFIQVQPEEERKMDLWPETPPSFRETLHEYSTKARKVVDKILEGLPKALGLDESCYFIKQLGEKSTAHARFNYYPRCSRPDLVFGFKPHADGSALTVVLQDQEVEGLQVLDKDGQWLKVPIVPNALLVNMGDQMEIMSNGMIKSPVHRVVTSSENDRISVALFYAVEPEKEIQPADGLVGEGRPRLYKKVKVKDFIHVFFQYFTQGKRTIDWAKV